MWWFTFFSSIILVGKCQQKFEDCWFWLDLQPGETGFFEPINHQLLVLLIFAHYSNNFWKVWQLTRKDPQRLWGAYFCNAVGLPALILTSQSCSFKSFCISPLQKAYEDESERYIPQNIKTFKRLVHDVYCERG